MKLNFQPVAKNLLQRNAPSCINATMSEQVTEMTLNEFIVGLQKAGCGFVEGGTFPGTTTRVIIARRETNRVRIFPFFDEPGDTRVSREFLGRAYVALFASE